MKSVIEITARCKELLEVSNIPDSHKSVLREKYDHIETKIFKDRATVTNCERQALHQFQKMLQDAQDLHDCPSAAFAYANLLQSSIAVLNFLSQNPSDTSEG